MRMLTFRSSRTVAARARDQGPGQRLHMSDIEEH
jgi:hypothetical protein